MSGYLRFQVQGDHYSMGRQHGQQVRSLRPAILEAMAARQHQIEGDGADERFETLVRDTADVMAAADPECVALVRGQAEALEIDFHALMRYGLTSYLRDDLLTRRPPAGEGCTTWAASGVSTADGRPILVKNRDYRLEHLRLQIVVRARPARGYEYCFVGSAGSPGVFSGGINAAGLAVADTHVSSTDLGPGLPDYALMMRLLEEHDSVASALDYLRAAPRLGRNNLILADAAGALAVFEIGHRRFGLRETRAGVLVNTNHFVSSDLEQSCVEVESPSMQGNSQARHRRVTAALAQAHGQIDETLAKALMAAHAGPLDSICRHPAPGSETATISCSIFRPAERRMAFCHGLPCEGGYDAYDIG